MKPTLEQLQELTELEINIAVTEKLKTTYEVLDGKVFPAAKHDGDNVISIMSNVDYCNNWADMGALANKHNISAIYSNTTKEWCAYAEDDTSECWHQNELRAKAIVFLMMEV